MLERLINEDKEGAEELFHEIVVEKSREIYENILEDDLEIDEADEDEDEDIDEAMDDDDDEDEVEESKDEDEDDDEMSEDFDLDEFEVEADDDMMGGDPADAMMTAMGDEGDMDDMGDMGDEDEEGIEDRVTDLEAALDELQQEFEELMADEEGGDGEEDDDMDADDEEDMGDEDMGDEDMADDEGEEEAEESVALSPTEQMREYVEKVAGGHGAESKGGNETADNKKSVVAGKNDMGGTASNLNQGGENKGGDHAGLADINAKEDSMNQVNTPGSKNATNMRSVAKGHGAEKKGSGEVADNKKSTIGS